MSRIRIACFSSLGERLGQRICPGEWTRFPGEISLTEWTRQGFLEADALVFVASCGIAVRAIAPFIRSKLTDPAVLVADETGEYVIPILSGHMGGANDLASQIAQKIGAHAVITTATDLRQTFSADSWAVANGFGIVNPEAVKTISAAVLDGEEIELRVRGRSDSSVTTRTADGRSADSQEEHRDSRTLRLVPRTVIVGAGCRKGTDPEYMEECFRTFCARHGFEPASVLGIATIDLKKDEPALRQLTGRRKIPLFAYSAGQLMDTPGDYSPSEFVLRTTGADNVCERAAVRASIEVDGISRAASATGTGADGISRPDPASGGASAGSEEERLFLRKEIYDGITFAAARVQTVRRWKWL